MENEVVKSEGQLRWHMVSSSSPLYLPPHVTAAAAAVVGNCHQKGLSGIQFVQALFKKPECIEVVWRTSEETMALCLSIRSHTDVREEKRWLYMKLVRSFSHWSVFTVFFYSVCTPYCENSVVISLKVRYFFFGLSMYTVH
uniref:Uncharacterized protein n=1 Tax=Oryza punctata TaxID=4537 RepID=A0A0E0L311_ORYPU